MGASRCPLNFAEMCANCPSAWSHFGPKRTAPSHDGPHGVGADGIVIPRGFSALKSMK
jgi:hypothetical protein